MIAAIGARGEGKSHWLHQQIRDELKKGRVVYTNSATINFEAMSRQTGIDPETLAQQLVVLPQDRWRDRTIWPVWEPDHTVVQAGIFPPGCLIVIDEAHFFLGAELPTVPLEFLRFHDMSRHMTDANGVPIDVFVSSQYRTSFHKEVKRRIEYVYEFKNLDVNGLMKGAGSVGKFRTANNYKSNFISEEKYFRDKSVYELYHSTVTGGGSAIAEQVSNKKLVRRVVGFVAFCGLLVVGAVGFSIWQFGALATGKTPFSQDEGKGAASGAASLVKSPGLPPTAPSCGGAFYMASGTVYLITSDGSTTDVSAMVQQSGARCVLKRGGCEWSVGGACPARGL